MSEQKLPMLPPNAELETKAVLKQLARANRALAELKEPVKLFIHHLQGKLKSESF